MLRKGWMAVAISMTLAAGSASASHCELDFDSDYALRLDHGDLEFTSHSNQGPQKIRIEGSRVFVDGKELTLSAEQRARVADFSQNVGGLAQDAVAIGLEGVDIAYVAVTEVAKMFQDSNSERKDLTERLNRSRAEVQKNIAAFSESGDLNEAALERLIEDNVETVVGDLVGVVVGEIVGEAISIALSGDEAKAKELEARADALEKTIEEKVERRADALEDKAEALCQRAKSLGDLDNAMALRTDNGTAIDLLR